MVDYYPIELRIHKFRAMGSQFKFWLESDIRYSDRVLVKAESLVRKIEEILTRFNPESELNRLNARPGEWVPVSPTLWDALWYALSMTLKTGGLYNPTLLTDVENAGYDRSFDELAIHQHNEHRTTLTPRSNPELWQAILLRKSPRSVWLPHSVRLDLGGIGKGYAAQRVVQFFKKHSPCLVDAGGDITAGAAPTGLSGWPVAISAPIAGPQAPARDVIGVMMANESLATSGIDYRRWSHDGEDQHHIIDPRTGKPARTDIVSASILSAHAVEAEAMATAALVAGQDAGMRMLERMSQSAVLINADGEMCLTGDLIDRAMWQLSVIREWDIHTERNIYYAITS